MLAVKDAFFERMEEFYPAVQDQLRRNGYDDAAVLRKMGDSKFLDTHIPRHMPADHVICGRLVQAVKKFEHDLCPVTGKSLVTDELYAAVTRVLRHGARNRLSDYLSRDECCQVLHGRPGQLLQYRARRGTSQQEGVHALVRSHSSPVQSNIFFILTHIPALWDHCEHISMLVKVRTPVLVCPQFNKASKGSNTGVPLASELIFALAHRRNQQTNRTNWGAHDFGHFNMLEIQEQQELYASLGVPDAHRGWTAVDRTIKPAEFGVIDLKEKLEAMLKPLTDSGQSQLSQLDGPIYSGIFVWLVCFV